MNRGLEDAAIKTGFRRNQIGTETEYSYIQHSVLSFAAKFTSLALISLDAL